MTNAGHRNHLAGDRSRVLQVVFRPGAHFAKLQILGCPAAEKALDAIQLPAVKPAPYRIPVD